MKHKVFLFAFMIATTLLMFISAIVLMVNPQGSSLEIIISNFLIDVPICIAIGFVDYYFFSSPEILDKDNLLIHNGRSRRRLLHYGLYRFRIFHLVDPESHFSADVFFDMEWNNNIIYRVVSLQYRSI